MAERQEKKNPDFRCELPGGKAFYVEVKSFDAAGGKQRNLEMMNDGLRGRVELEEQQATGRDVVSVETEYAPYRKPGETVSYDPRSLVTAINALQEKARRAFQGDSSRRARHLRWQKLAGSFSPMADSIWLPTIIRTTATAASQAGYCGIWRTDGQAARY